MAGSTAQFPLTASQARAVKRSLQKIHKDSSFRIVGRAPHYFVEERTSIEGEEGQRTFAYNVTIYGRPLKSQPRNRRKTPRIVTAATQLKPVRVA